MASDKMQQNLPKWAIQTFNRCSLPVEVFGGVRFQHEPLEVRLDGIDTLYKDLFQELDRLEEAHERRHYFLDYMSVHFLLDTPQKAGATDQTKRRKSTYLRLLRGWFFDPDGREAAVLKGWVASRFGLVPCYHGGRIVNKTTDAYHKYEHERSSGLYNTHAMETQLDLLYSFAQYELKRTLPPQSGFTLYRGVNRLNDFNMSPITASGDAVALLNNINSFSSEKETAGTFGDMIMETFVPKEKIFCFPGLLGQKFKSEQEYMVLGGLYMVRLTYY